MKQLRKKARLSFELQQDESDCGVAALASIIQFHGGYVPMERLRSLSGTTRAGTTLLGLMQAGEDVSLIAEAFEGSISELRKITNPTLLHIVKHDVIEHYIVCYGFNGSEVLIGDPEEGLKVVSDQELEQAWKSKCLLTLAPSPSFVKAKKIAKEKYRWIIQSLLVDQKLILASLIIGITVALLSFVTAVFTDKLVDNLIPSKNATVILLGLSSWFALMFMKSIFGYLRDLLLIRQSFLLDTRLTGDFIHRLVHLPKSFFDSRKKGDLIGRLFDTGRIQNSLGVMISLDVIDFLTLIASLVFLLFYSKTIALFLMIVIPAYFLIVYNYYAKIYASNKKVMTAYARNEAAYIDTLMGIEAIKQFSKEKSESLNLKDQFTHFQKSVMSVEKLGASFRIIMEFFGLLCILFILVFGINSVLTAKMEVGDLLAVFSIATLSLSSTSRLAYAITHLQEARAALDRTYDVVSLPTESKTGVILQTCDAIRFDNVSFGFAGSLPLFEDVCMTIQKGQITVLLGDNGTGKSTLLQIVQKFYHPQSGTILFDDTSIEEIDAESLRKLVGVVPQNFKIFNQSLAYNICMSHDYDAHELLDFCEGIGMADFVESFREGIDTILGEEGVNVSGGQKQMIALARALFNKPAFLFLDEFTASMDKATKKYAIGLVANLKDKMGIFIITHDERLSRIATRQYALSESRVKELSLQQQL